MSRTPVSAFGRLQIGYSAYGKPHVLRCYVPVFLTDPAVGTFDAPGTPASLDDLATDIGNLLVPFYASGASVTFGEWQGQKHVALTDESFIPIVTGTVTGITATPSGSTNPTGAPTQNTFHFRSNSGKLIKIELFGQINGGSQVYRYSTLPSASKAFADYVLASTRILGRDNSGVASLVSMTFDTNDGLQRRYRR